MSARLLIVGADGVLGGALVRHCVSHGIHVVATALAPASSAEGWLRFDLAQPESSWPVLPPCDAAILCAAISRLDQCRSDPSGTRWINVVQTACLARRLSSQGSFIIFPSSNLVFDGSRSSVDAREAFSPMTEYGRQKAETEQALRPLGETGHAVVRLTKVIHPRFALACRWIADLRAGRAVAPWENLRCAPLDLAVVVHGLLSVAVKRLGGIWQFSPMEDVSYSQLARLIAGQFGFAESLVRPTLAAAADALEHAPAHTTLDATRAMQALGLTFDSAAAVLSRTNFNEH